MVICLESGAHGLHMVQLMPLPPIICCFIKIQNGSVFLVPAYPDCPGKRPLNGCSRVLMSDCRLLKQFSSCMILALFSIFRMSF